MLLIHFIIYYLSLCWFSFNLADKYPPKNWRKILKWCSLALETRWMIQWVYSVLLSFVGEIRARTTLATRETSKRPDKISGHSGFRSEFKEGEPALISFPLPSFLLWFYIFLPSSRLTSHFTPLLTLLSLVLEVILLKHVL